MSSQSRLLITGVSGFLGGHLGLASRQTGMRVYGSYYRNNVRIPGVFTVQHNYQNQLPTAWLAELQPAAIIHTTAFSSPAYVEKWTDSTQYLNVQFPAELACWCRDHGTRLLVMSSDQVYDGAHGDHRETEPARPVNAYGRQKSAMEDAVLKEYPQASVIRVPLLLGKPAFGGTSFSEWVAGRLQAMQEVPLYTNQIRSALAVDTLATALTKAMTIQMPGIWNAGGLKGYSRLEIGVAVAAALKTPEPMLRPVIFEAHQEDTPAPLDISMISDRFYELTGVQREPLPQALERIYG